MERERERERKRDRDRWDEINGRHAKKNLMRKTKRDADRSSLRELVKREMEGKSWSYDVQSTSFLAGPHSDVFSWSLQLTPCKIDKNRIGLGTEIREEEEGEEEEEEEEEKEEEEEEGEGKKEREGWKERKRARDR